MKRTCLALLLLMAPAYAGEPLGPSGAAQTEPSPIPDEYKPDLAAAETCPKHPDGMDELKIGEKAVYGVTGESVTVFLDEYARRYAIDYCWV